MKRLPILALTVVSVAALSLTGCGQTGGDTASATDTLTRRQKDSLISTMPVPGAGAVGKAMGAADAASAQAAQHDSLLNNR